MPDTNDELERLARADPVDQASLPSAGDQRARALFEEITMSDPTPQATTPQPKTIWIVGAAAAVALLIAAVAGLAVSRDDDSPSDSEDVASGPISPGGATSGSCVEVYDTDTLANREVAFDGTVSTVEGDSVTFTVNAAFKGVSTETVTLNGAVALSGMSSAGSSGTALEPGARMLVAGDGGFAWSCGFTQPYDPGVAGEWSQVFGS